MIRPDEVIAAVGGRVMERQGHPFVQGGRVSQQTPAEFTRSGPAWVRYGLERFAKVGGGFARWGRFSGKKDGIRTRSLTLVLEDAVTQLVAETNRISTSAWTFFGCSPSTTAPTVEHPFEGFGDIQPIVKDDGQTNRGFYQLISASSETAIQMIARNYNQQLGQEGSFSLVDQGGSGNTYRLRLNFLTGEVQRVSSGNTGWRESGSEFLGNGWWRYWLAADISAYSGTPRLEVRLERTTTGSVGVGFYPAYVGAEAGRFVHQPLVSTSSTSVTKAAEEYRISNLRGASAGPLSYYQMSVATDRPGEGGTPTLSTSGEYFGVAKGWTDGARQLVGGAVYQSGDRIISVGSTSPAIQPQDLKEELARISTDGRLTYEISVNGGRVHRVTSTDAILPTRKTGLPRLELAGDQQNVVSILARGSHRIEAFRRFFR